MTEPHPPYSPPPANWYPDPARRYQLRFWDGTQWTAHIATAGIVGVEPFPPPAPAPVLPPPRSVRTRRTFGWLSLILALIAVAAIAFSVGLYAHTSSQPSVRLDGTRQLLDLPPNTEYGIYVDDADNSGYSQSCSAFDADGRRIHLRDPSWNVSDSETENLDLVFNTGSGQVTMMCSVPGERVTARPVPNFGAFALGILAGGIAATTALAFLIVWLTSSKPGRPTSKAQAMTPTPE